MKLSTRKFLHKNFYYPQYKCAEGTQFKTLPFIINIQYTSFHITIAPLQLYLSPEYLVFLSATGLPHGQL